MTTRKPKGMTVAEALALPVSFPMWPTIGRAYPAIGRDLAYRLAATGELPVPVLRLGRRLVVTRASLLAALGITDTAANPDEPLTTPAFAPVIASASDIRSDAQAMREAA